MNNRESKIKEISNELSKIELNVRNLNYQNLNDINILQEITFKTILNIIFDYSLINLGETSAGFPAVDLVDDDNRISVQVSSNSSKHKIQSTLDSFEKNCFYKKYDRLIILIIGEKQRKYTNLRLSENFSFNENEDIIDFKSLLRFITFLPINKIDKILACLQTESGQPNKKGKTTEISRTRFNQIQSLKKNIEQNLTHNYTEDEYYKFREHLMCNPSRKFVYSHLIVRSIDDKSFPDGNPTGRQSWFKGEIWNFYEGGLEFVHGGSPYVVIEEDESWYLTEDKIEKSQNCWLFLRIPYENMVKLDMEPDGYHGYPTLYVEFSKDGNLYEETVYGLIGYYKQGNPPKSRMTYYLDNDKQK